jgi:glycosyltransferase involved in cell wall biosynthesis
MEDGDSLTSGRGTDRVLRVVLCTDGVFPHALGGMQRHSRLLAEHLARTPGIEITVLHPHDVQVFAPASGIHEAHVAPLDPGRNYLLELWRYSGRMAAAVEALNPDAVLSQGFSVWKGSQAFSGRLLVMPHGLEMFQGLTMRDRVIGWPFRIALRSVVRKAAVVVSLGGRLTPILERLTRGSRARVAVVPNAVEAPAIPPPFPVDRRPLNLLFVGRFAFNKGIDVLLQVARRLVDEGRGDEVRFVLAGDGPEKARMERDGLPSNVMLAGKVDDARLEQLYAECHALVLPTRFEGMPTVVLEAMARARPVIVSDVGASAELVDSTNGWLLPAGDPHALHQAILGMLALPLDSLKAKGAAGRSRVTERFTWERVVNAFSELLAARTVSAPSHP